MLLGLTEDVNEQYRDVNEASLVGVKDLRWCTEGRPANDGQVELLLNYGQC